MAALFIYSFMIATSAWSPVWRGVAGPGSADASGGAALDRGDARIVPDLREASYALGVPKWKTIVKVVIPTAFGGISPASCSASPG